MASHQRECYVVIKQNYCPHSWFSSGNGTALSCQNISRTVALLFESNPSWLEKDICAGNMSHTRVSVVSVRCWWGVTRGLGNWVLERRRGVNQERVPWATEARAASIFPQSCRGAGGLPQPWHTYPSTLVENDPCIDTCSKCEHLLEYDFHDGRSIISRGTARCVIKSIQIFC